MKKFLLPIVVSALVISLLLIPSGFLGASPGELVVNGDFSDGLNHWDSWGDVSVNGNVRLGPKDMSYVYQHYISTSNKNLIFSCDAMRTNDSGSFAMAFMLAKGGFATSPESAEKYFTPTVNKWVKLSYSISDIWKSYHGSDIPDFDKIAIWVMNYEGCIVYIDNISLKAPSSTQQAEEPQVWVRDREMTCYQVWINEDNNFEFVFWWEYKNNNWVKIYDMAGAEVFSIDMKYGNAKFTADLPDGMYTVKTFHTDLEKPIQEFMIGKP